MSSSGEQSVEADYFDAKYRADADPWNYAASAYEDAKYAATLAALLRDRYRSALEIGCSIGVLTARLAARCDQLLAIDAAPTAIARTRSRCRHLPQVSFACMQVPRAFPQETFDLIVLSEVGYYLTLADLEATQRLIVQQLVPGGHLLLVHWTPPIDDALLTGDAVHDQFLRHAYPGSDLRHLTGRREQVYRLDLFERAGA